MVARALHRFVCWDIDRIGKVINKEAVSVDPAIFLATHRPFDRITYIKTPSKLESTTESDLLGDLTRRAKKNEHVFAVIQGIPGSGKSHLIRWLMERYAAENSTQDGRDVVFLIERANNTLRQTLQQLIDSNLFDSELFSLQRERLARSANQLSEEALEEELIGNLQVAFVEDRKRATASLKPQLSGRLNDFLLDSSIRSELRRNGGPIKRIVRFLSAGDTRDTGDVLPAFQADDFDFDPQFLQRFSQEVIRPDTRALVNKLSSDTNRSELAAYLNSLLEFAIGRTTALSSDDLKQMFNDLRRELRRQNRNLALFIEDITAFTGLDTGLLDILVTQHTGVGNTEFCRILSVVGVTDDYYNKRFPDNVRDRISHHLTLNRLQSNTDTELLSTKDAVADLAGRYLNAIRLEPEKLVEWHADGANPERLPNACTHCHLKSECHQDFGSISIDEQEDDTSAEIGLYPFNANALWQMYQKVNTNITLKTPRTFLNSIISYVLESHTERIQNGNFPPPREQMGGEFGAPTLANPMERNLLSAQGVSAVDSDRLESLIVFWGDRTLQTGKVDNDLRWGSLSQGVFHTFGLPFLADVLPLSSAPSLARSDGGQVPEVTPSTVDTIKSTPEVSSPKQRRDPVIEDIEAWRAGKRLKEYSSLGQALARQIQTGIDWDTYGLARPLVEDRIRQARFVIEDQDGRSNSRYTLRFEKSDRLVNVLYAVHALEGNTTDIAPEVLSSHLTALSVWLKENEVRLVEFVKAPEDGVEGVPDLLRLQLQTATALAVLAGELGVKTAESPEEFAQTLVRFCASTTQWERVTKESGQKRSTEWMRLTRNNSLRQDGELAGTDLLDSLSCPQGRSRNVIFLDMALLLDQIQQLPKADWGFPLPGFAGEGNIWRRQTNIIGTLSGKFWQAMEAERARLTDILSQLEQLTGKLNGRDLDRTIRQFFQGLSTLGYQPPASLALDVKPPFVSMEQNLTVLQNLTQETNSLKFIQRASGVLEYVNRALRYTSYLEDLYKFAQNRQNLWQRELEDAADSRAAIAHMRKEIDELYQASENMLGSVSAIGGEQ